MTYPESEYETPTHEELMKHPWFGIRPFLRHSLVLMVSGSIYIMIGIAILIAPPQESNLIALEYAVRIMDYQNWGWVWVAAGAIAMISSRWPPISETWGYMVLTGLSAGWAAFYWSAIMWGDSPDTNLRGVFSWGLIAFLWWAISGLVNPHALQRLTAQIVELQHENIQLMKENTDLRCKRG